MRYGGGVLCPWPCCTGEVRGEGRLGRGRGQGRVWSGQELRGGMEVRGGQGGEVK